MRIAARADRMRLLVSLLLGSALGLVACRDDTDGRGAPSGTADEGQTNQPPSREEAEAAAHEPEPPADPEEQAGPAPSADHTWIHGHWQWSGRRWSWTAGHWDLAVAPNAPPPPRVEPHGRPPGPRHVWIAGYWRWEGSWLWVNGHWGSRRNGHEYAQGRWEPRRTGRFVWAPGHWVR